MKAAWILAVVTTLLAQGSVMMLAQSATSSSTLIEIIHIEGKVYLNEQNVEPSITPVRVNVNSIVRTEDGRAEIRLYESVLVLLGGNASLRVADNRPPRFELLTGSTVVATGDMGSLVTCENTVTLSHSGLYRFDVIHLPGGVAAQRPKAVWIEGYSRWCCGAIAERGLRADERRLHEPKSWLRRSNTHSKIQC
jgi:hypothetical protein